MKKKLLTIFFTVLMLACLLSTTALAEVCTPATVTGRDGLVYNGKSQTLVNVDTSAKNCIMYYYVSETDEEPSPDDINGWSTTATAVAATNAGTYYVWYYGKGTGNYENTPLSDAICVTISPLTLEKDPKVAVKSSLIYNGTKQTPKIGVTAPGISVEMKIEDDYTLTCENNINAGTNTASVTIKANEGGNYIFKDVTVPFSIGKAAAPKVDAKSVALVKPSREYEPGNKTVEVEFTNPEGYAIAKGVNGEEMVIHSVVGSLTSDGAGSNKTVTLKAGKDDAEYKNGFNPDNYKEGATFADALKFTIDKAEFEYQAPTAREVFANGSPQQLVEAGSTPQGTTMYYRLSGTNEWKNSANGVTATNEGTYAVEYYIDGKQNYKSYGSAADPYTVEVTILSGTGSTISGGSIAIISVVAVVAIGALIVISKKKRAGAN